MGTIMKTDSANYANIADAIREKNGEETTYLPSEMANAIRSIPGGGGASYTDVTGTLAVGDTTITLSDEAILTTSTIDFYTDVYGVNPTAVTVSTGSITLTFDVQADPISVKVRIW